MALSSVFAIAAAAAVVAVGAYHFGFVAPRLRRLSGALTVAEGDEASLAALRATGAARAKATNLRLELLEATVARDLLRVGFVRYNSFRDVGSDQSFTLALVNASGDGIVVSSIFGREETRTYGKSVRGFSASHGASEEEEAAIAMARSGSGAFVRA